MVRLDHARRRRASDVASADDDGARACSEKETVVPKADYRLLIDPIASAPVEPPLSGGTVIGGWCGTHPVVEGATDYPWELQDLRRTVDRGWDVACRKVLESYAIRSNPAMLTVIDQVNRRFLAAAADGVVPSRSVAYLRLGELDHGRYTFRAAKQRRSVAKRPTGVLGRLRADRPGQYVLLDSYRLDVFGMGPVALRWVNTELTVAMDLFDRCITGIRLHPVAARSPDVASVLFQTVTPQTSGVGGRFPAGPVRRFVGRDRARRPGRGAAGHDRRPRARR